MKHTMKLFLAMAILACAIGDLNAQYVTSHAKISMPGQQKGIYYALPRTVIQLDFMVDKTELIEGPYSDYAYMIGTDDVIVGNQTEYVLKDVVMGSYAEADPNATFFVAMSPRKGESQPFYLNAKGILEGVGMTNETPVAQPEAQVKAYVATADNTFKYQFSSNGMRSEEQQARSAADMIGRIREEKIKLLTGFQETAFTLDTYRQMYADLDEMEREYTSLFIGKRVVTPIVQTAYVTLSKDVPLQTVGSFTKQAGFSTKAVGGSTVTVQAISLQTTSNINALSPSAVESLSHENKLFYRIPETANVKVSMGDNIILESRMTIAQFGLFMLAPLDRTQMLLDPNTGQIIKMGME